jgi:uncharacterized membrane protein YfcA
LIGLGGAEFRLPLLIGVFGFGALEAVILNKALSLVVVLTALPFRAAVVPFSQLFEHWNVIITLLSGSLAGAWYGEGWATKIHSTTLYKIIAAGSIIGSYLGGQLLGMIPTSILLPLLAIILLVSAVKVWRHSLK